MSEESTQLATQLKDKLREIQDAKFPPVHQPETLISSKFGEKRDLRGHFQKVYAIDWAGKGSDLFLSASQDGKLIVWNALTTNKLNAISLDDVWVMSCAFEKSNNRYVATGGLKNICYIYKQGDYEPGHQVKPERMLMGHQGYISCTKFMSENSIVTSSGDSTCRMWDIENQKTTILFRGHGSDVMSISPCPVNPDLFISGSLDLECKLWDARLKGEVPVKPKKPANPFSWDEEQENAESEIGSIMYYEGHDSDVNSVAFFPDGFAFASGSDDQTCRLWDIRCHQEVNVFKNVEILHAVNSIAFSSSGRLLFAGYEDCKLIVWDTLKPAGEDGTAPLLTLDRHSGKISEVSVHSEGKAIATASWDTLIKVFA